MGYMVDLVQQGISEKVALVVHFTAAFLTGFILAYARQWKLALALTSIIPCNAICGVLMNKFVSTYTQQSLEHVASGGSIAEEVISTVRTAHAFGSQDALSGLYNIHIMKSRKAGIKSAIAQAAAFSVFVFVIYSAYALGEYLFSSKPSSQVSLFLIAFSFGTTLINANEGELPWNYS